MSDATAVPPGHRWAITCPTLGRLQLFTPRFPVLQQTFDFLVGVGAKKYGLGMVVWTLLPDHYHMVVDDPDGRNPAFVQWLNSRMALATNEHFGTCGIVFHPGECCRQILLDPEVELREIAYCSANATKHGYVARSADFPGARSGVEHLGRQRGVERPDTAFFRRSSYPTKVVLDPGLHGAAWSEASRAELRAELEYRQRDREAFHARRLRRAGRAFIGRRGCKRIVWHRTRTAPVRRGRKPIFAASCDERKRAFLRAYGDWLDRYRAALELWRDGRHSDAEFPCGTWRMVWSLGARIAAA